ncbi:MAG: hypothetical protein B6I20_04375 [Bacteroidetes bacterium 4572_117]|nr:MAG: hypothetical protein B6I20_04375 [Bacteroidetes bacterium 4572_117]
MLQLFPITGLMFLSLGILLIFRLIRLVFDKFIVSILVKHWLKRALFTFEFIVWIIVIYQLADLSLNEKPILSVIMFLLLIFILAWSFWFILRDFLAGIYIRISGRFKLNETIAFDAVNGKIIRFADLYFVIEKPNGTTVEIPYNKLFSKKMERYVQSAEEELNLSFEIKSSKNREIVIEKIKKQVLELPWISHKHETKLILQKQADGKIRLNLTVILLNKKYKNSVEEILTESITK